MSGSGGERPGRKVCECCFFSFGGAVAEDTESITPSSAYHWQAPRSELFANYHWFRYCLRKGRDTLALRLRHTHTHTQERCTNTLRHAYKRAVTLGWWQQKKGGKRCCILTHLHRRAAARGLRAQSRGSAPCTATELCTIGTIIIINFFFFKNYNSQSFVTLFQNLILNSGPVVMVR